MTSDELRYLLSWAAGVALGGMFFGGLWWTVRLGMTSKRAAFWFLGSMLARTSLVLVGIFLITRGHWERMVPCLAGFIMARLAVSWFTRPQPAKLASQGREAGNAS